MELNNVNTNPITKLNTQIFNGVNIVLDLIRNMYISSFDTSENVIYWVNLYQSMVWLLSMFKS